MVFTLFYTSRSTLRLPHQVSEVETIVDFSRRYNTMNGISGALMFTEQNFAQFLEGSQQDVEALMRRIRRDERHADVDVIFQVPVAERRFPGWSMAYSGPNFFMEREFEAISKASDDPDRHAAAGVIIDLMSGFVGPRRIEH